jgi:predicted small lipoprotein YifL
MRNASVVVLIGVAGMLLACGQKGPLVLPDAVHPHKKIGAPKQPAAAPAKTPPAPNAAPPAAPPGTPQPGAAAGAEPSTTSTPQPVAH